MTDKASIVEHPRKSLGHCKKAVANLTDEHLGQAIAHARMNQVVPP